MAVGHALCMVMGNFTRLQNAKLVQGKALNFDLALGSCCLQTQKGQVTRSYDVLAFLRDTRNPARRWLQD